MCDSVNKLLIPDNLGMDSNDDQLNPPIPNFRKYCESHARRYIHSESMRFLKNACVVFDEHALAYQRENEEIWFDMFYNGTTLTTERCERLDEMWSHVRIMSQGKKLFMCFFL